MHVLRLLVIVVAAVPFVSLRLAAQEPAASTSQLLRVFLDCQQTYCDLDFFRKNITFVDYVRTPDDADVHILLTSQPTGGGGQQFTMTFIGRNAFAARRDTLTWYASRDATDDETRRGLSRQLSIGLLRYIAGTPESEHISVTYSAPVTQATGQKARDPWNYWVFRTRASSFFQGESSSRSVNLHGSLSASRVTDQMKLELRLDGSYSRSRFQVDSVTDVISSSQSYSADALLAWSIGGRWAAGGQVSASRSTYLNEALKLRVAPGIEYDFFPYSESTRRLLTARYQLGINGFRYDEETIFDKTSETLFDESLQLALNANQRWGSASLNLEAAHYLDDPSKYHVQIFGSADVRLFKGLSLNFFASVARIHDQRYLSQAGATPDEILLQRKALATSYQYFGSVGLSYTFGSIYNNVVNPRFGNGAGGIYYSN